MWSLGRGAIVRRMVFAGQTGIDVGTVFFVLVALALFVLLSFMGGLTAYAFTPTRLAFALGTATFALIVGLAPLSQWLAIVPSPADRLLEAGIASAALGLGLRRRTSPAHATVSTPRRRLPSGT